jgi:hypothetical protein
MKLSQRFRAGTITTENSSHGVYAGFHFWGLDWAVMLMHPTRKNISQFSLFRIQALDLGLFESDGQTIIFEINFVGFILSFRYMIPNYGKTE